MEREELIDHINKLESLEIGLTFSEISDYLEGSTGERPKSGVLKRILLSPKTNLSSIDPDSLAVKLAGKRCRIRKGKGTYKRRDFFNGKLLYVGRENVYFRRPGIGITRIIYEIRESSTSSISISILDKLNEIGPATEAQIFYKTNNRKYALIWLKRHVSKGIVVRADEDHLDLPNNGNGEKLYDLADLVKPSYNSRMKNLWEGVKEWERRRCFYD